MRFPIMSPRNIRMTFAETPEPCSGVLEVSEPGRTEAESIKCLGNAAMGVIRFQEMVQPAIAGAARKQYVRSLRSHR